MMTGQMASKLDNPSHTISINIRGKSPAKDQTVEESLKRSTTKRKASSVDDRPIKRKTFVVNSDTE